MESVAKSVQGPIKILFVSAWADPTADPPSKIKTSLLGLGDIVVPGRSCVHLASTTVACLHRCASVAVEGGGGGAGGGVLASCIAWPLDHTDIRVSGGKGRGHGNAWMERCSGGVAPSNAAFHY